MNRQELSKRWFKLRFAIIYPFGVYFVIFSNSSHDSLKAAIGWIISGLFIRLWANGYAIKMDKLTTCGPYAFVRHPLYLGTMLIVIGFVILLNIQLIGVFFIGIIAIVYYRTIMKEELMRREKFKEMYLEYKKKVPAIIPTVLPYRKGEKWPFSVKRLIKSQEYKLLFWIIILVVAFHLKQDLIVEREPMNLKMWGLVILAFLLGLTDATGELIRQKDGE